MQAPILPTNTERPNLSTTLACNIHYISNITNIEKITTNNRLAFVKNSLVSIAVNGINHVSIIRNQAHLHPLVSLCKDDVFTSH